MRRKIHWRPVASYLALSLLPPLLFLSLPPGAAYDDTDLTMDFDQMPYLHHNPGGVRFGEATRLVRYALSAGELSPGETLSVILDWSVAGGAYTATARLFSPAALRHEVEPLAEASLRVRDGPQVVALRLPDDIARGVYLVQLRLYGPEGELQSLTPGGQSCGPLYLQPVRVPDGPELPGDAPVLAPFGPSIRLHSASVSQLASDRLAVRLGWSTAHPLAANYGISLRLLDSAGETVGTLDTQPGYGFLPTSMWRPGELVTDRYILHVPQDVPPAGEYSLQVILYHVATGEAIAQTRLGEFAVPLTAPFEARRPPRAFELPSQQHRVQVDFGGEVRLAGYELEQQMDTLRLTLWWQALRTPSADYTVFVHLFDPATEVVVVQSDASPQEGAYPTSWWATGEVVSETISLPLEGLRAGVYRLAVGIYDRAVTRLVAIDAEGHRVTDDRWVLPQAVEIR